MQSGEILEGGFYSETETIPIVMFASYKIENEVLVKKDIEIIGEEIEHNFNFFDCVDVNEDGKKDIVAQVFSQQWTEQDNNLGVPEVYIRNGDSFSNIFESGLNDTFVPFKFFLHFFLVNLLLGIPLLYI